MMTNAFYLIKNDFLVSRYLNFCPDFFGYVGKRLDKKARVNFKCYDTTVWDTNNCNTHIDQYLKK